MLLRCIPLLVSASLIFLCMVLTFKSTKCITLDVKWFRGHLSRLSHVLLIGLYIIVFRYLTSEGWDLFHELNI